MSCRRQFYNLLLIVVVLPFQATMARDCDQDASPVLINAQFTSRVRSQQPQDDLLYLPVSAREIYVHATTRGEGKITYRWLRDGKRVMDVGVNVGKGEWHTWSRLRLPPPVPNDVRVQVLGPGECLLRDMTLAATALVDQPDIAKAWQQLAAGDATGAKITLKMLLETAPSRSTLARTAQRMLDIDVVLAQAQTRASGDELFLVEPALKAMEKKLGKSAADRGIRTRIEKIRSVARLHRQHLAREGSLMAIATRHLLETGKIFTGDYPLLREDAERLVVPALRHAGDAYAMVDWQPTLRGYKLTLQDKRSGDALLVTPD